MDNYTFALLAWRRPFDSVSRKELWKVLESRAVNMGLIENMKSMYTNNRNLVRTQNQCTKVFITKKRGQARRDIESTAIRRNAERDSWCNGTANKRCQIENQKSSFGGTERANVRRWSDSTGKQDLQRNLEIWKAALEDRGLKISIAISHTSTVQW